MYTSGKQKHREAAITNFNFQYDFDTQFSVSVDTEYRSDNAHNEFRSDTFPKLGYITQKLWEVLWFPTCKLLFWALGHSRNSHHLIFIKPKVWIVKFTLI